MSDYLHNRNGRYYYRRRVPSEVASYDNRETVCISLKTNDVRAAKRKADIYNEQIEEYWRSLIVTGSTYEEQSYKQAVAIARAHGFNYKYAADIAKSPIQEIVDRVLLVQSNQNPEMVAGILGGVDQPELLISECLDKYWPLCVDRLTKKSDQQIHRWKTLRTTVMKNFLRIVGDKPIAKIDRKDVMILKEYWAQKIAKRERSTDTANKQIRIARDILQTVADHAGMELDFTKPFAKTNFKRSTNSRPPFDAKYVQNVILAPGALPTLNDDCKYLIYAMADLGARPSELVALTPKDIFLDADIPFIWIRPSIDRELKTEHSERQIPLVGAALFAFKKMPDGFQRYATADSASAAINKYLTTRDLLPTPQHSLYSLRHTFKDRLRDAGAPEEVIDSLMGHETNRPKYGRGHNLETKKKWLEKIAYNPPAGVESMSTQQFV